MLIHGGGKSEPPKVRGCICGKSLTDAGEVGGAEWHVLSSGAA